MDKVDLALVLALDGSASVTFDEFGLMAGAMGAALRDPDIVTGLTAGPAQASLGCLLLWSGAGAQDVVVDWMRIGSPAQAADFADAVANVPRTVRPGETAIGEALVAALHLLARAPATATRQVVDVIGDGRSNQGIPPGPVRDRMADAGITINGLCVLHEEPDLLESYIREVIGGPGAFALPCPDYPAFALAMRRKLLTEIA
jgi:hypothetical protein